MSIINRANQSQSGKQQKSLYIAGFVVFLIIFVIVMLALVSSGSKIILTERGPIGFNALNSQLIGEDLYFYTGSTFAKLDKDGNTQALTSYFSMPSVVDVNLTKTYAVFSTVNNTPGTITFDKLFNDPKTINRINESHYWIVDFKSDKFERLSKKTKGEVNSSVKSSENTVLVSSFATVEGIRDGTKPITYLYEIDGQGGINQLDKLDGKYSVVSSNGKQSILLSDGYYYYDHSSKKLSPLERAFSSSPTVMKNGEVIGSVDVLKNNDESTLQETDTTTNLIYLDSTLNSNETTIIKRRFLVNMDNNGVVYALIKSGDKDISLESFTFDGSNITRQFIQIKDLLGIGVNKLYKITDSDYYLVDLSGVVYRASTNKLDLAPKLLPTIFEDCNTLFCIEPVSQNKVRVSLYRGSVEELKQKSLARFNELNIDPTQIQIEWFNLTVLN